MVTALVLFCYLPIGVIAAATPLSWIRVVERAFPIVAALPAASLLLAWAAARPLTSALSYGVALIPLGISYASLGTAVVGARLARRAAREGRPWMPLALFMVLAGLPFLGLAVAAAWELTRR